MHQFKIRRAEQRDIERIVRINNREKKWVGFHNRFFFEKHLGLPFFYVVEDGNGIAGFIMVMDQKSDYDSENFLWFRERLDRFYYIDRIVVDETKRGNGIGKALYEKLIEDRGGVPVVAEVAVEPVNPESIRFHEKFGFKEIGRFSAYGDKTCIMYKLD